MPPSASFACGRGSCSPRKLLASPALWAFTLVHAFALKGVLLDMPRWLPSRGVALLTLATYAVRMFGITAGYHRYFAHRSFCTSRAFQFVLAVLGASACQKGVLWWAGWHRHHHKHADSERDVHSPLQRGFWWSHLGWFLLSDEHSAVLYGMVPDLARYPELRALERLHLVPGILLALACYGGGGGGGYEAFVYGFLVSTVALWHATFTINSLAHMFGTRRFRCEFRGDCNARNNVLLALVTLGEGWHNNHHSFMSSARQGFYWYEVDASYWAIRALRAVRLVRRVREPPVAELERKRLSKEVQLRGGCSCTAAGTTMTTRTTMAAASSALAVPRLADIVATATEVAAGEYVA